MWSYHNSHKQKVDGVSTIENAHVLPISYVGYKDGLSILEHLNSNSPVATIIFHETVIMIYRTSGAELLGNLSGKN